MWPDTHCGSDIFNFEKHYLHVPHRTWQSTPTFGSCFLFSWQFLNSVVCHCSLNILMILMLWLETAQSDCGSFQAICLGIEPATPECGIMSHVHCLNVTGTFWINVMKYKEAFKMWCYHIHIESVMIWCFQFHMEGSRFGAIKYWQEPAGWKMNHAGTITVLLSTWLQCLTQPKNFAVRGTMLSMTQLSSIFTSCRISVFVFILMQGVLRMLL